MKPCIRSFPAFPLQKRKSGHKTTVRTDLEGFIKGVGLIGAGASEHGDGALVLDAGTGVGNRQCDCLGERCIVDQLHTPHKRRSITAQNGHRHSKEA